ncbi:MAG: hypothetical protein Q8R48_04415 [Candidatus Omnitrophota bacterium]|nr:hypothetical protein [Candidatus Omnitrophota bacterium]
MFSSRALNIALIASFMLHATLIAAVNIIVLPANFKIREFTAISFLGPILEKRALDIRVAGKPGPAATNYESDLRGGSAIHDVKNEAFQASDIVRKDISRQAEKKMNAALSMPFREVKGLPSAVRNVKKVSRDESRIKDTGISGPLAAREVFYRPAKPVVPGWISSNAPFNLELKFFVTAQGDVKEVIPLVSSGNAEVDLLGIRYLKEWKFTPTVTGGGEDWGRVKIIFSKE